MNKKYHATGIIVEYNPLHNGHIYHIGKSKEITQCDVLIAVMSPHFVQRGEPAIIDKWARTQLALEQGVDIVIELPTHITLQSAEVFAKGALKLLSMVKVDSIVYGSESLDKPLLNEIDKSLIEQGYSYAFAKNKTSAGPNQILGAYYENFAHKYNIDTHIVKRTQDYHDLSIDKEFASASAIRNAYLHQLKYQNTTPVNLDLYSTYHIKDAYPFIRYQILSQKEKLKEYLLVDEGIENLFYKLAKEHETYDGFLNGAISRRYTRSRIQRTLCHILLETPRILPEISAVRILGMSQVGRKYLHTIKHDTNLVTSFKDYPFKDLEEKSTALYVLLNPKENPLLKREMGPPIII
ncbi:MAG: nucleotidyltransferase family protein [Erysipelothrix sp.]|nr:nucleotidyltransferase family protein [Erysipelothrix sp.]